MRLDTAPVPVAPTIVPLGTLVIVESVSDGAGDRERIGQTAKVVGTEEESDHLLYILEFGDLESDGFYREEFRPLCTVNPREVVAKRPRESKYVTMKGEINGYEEP